MNASNEDGPAPESLEELPKYNHFRSGLDALSRVGRYDDRKHGGDMGAVRKIGKPRLPVAGARQREAAGSPSDRARWQALIAGMQQLGVGSEQGFIAVGTDTRGLVGALTEAIRPGPSVQVIADQLREGIAAGTYPPESMLSRARIRTDFGLAPASGERVALALQHLVNGGPVSVLPSKPGEGGGPGEADQPGRPGDRLAPSADHGRCLSLIRVAPQAPCPGRCRCTLLLPLAAHRHLGEPEMEAVLRRAAVSVLHDCRPEPGTEIWRVACLTSADPETLNLAGGAA